MNTHVYELINEITKEMNISEIREFKNNINKHFDEKIAKAVVNHNNKLSSTLAKNALIIEAHLNGEKNPAIAKNFKLECVQITKIIYRYKQNFIKQQQKNLSPVSLSDLNPKTITTENKQAFIHFSQNYGTYINQYAKTYGFNDKNIATLDIAIIDCELPVYIRNNLLSNGFSNLIEITSLSSKDFGAIPNLGRKAVSQIIEFLKLKSGYSPDII